MSLFTAEAVFLRGGGDQGRNADVRAVYSMPVEII
jgi:hypothetical protein